MATKTKGKKPAGVRREGKTEEFWETAQELHKAATEAEKVYAESKQTTRQFKKEWKEAEAKLLGFLDDPELPLFDRTPGDNGEAEATEGGAE